MRVTAVIPVYNEEDVIYWTVKNLVEQGINVHVLDNESKDSTLKIVRGFPRSNVSVSSFSTNNQYNEEIQTDNTRRVMHEIEKENDWLIKNDADEYLEPPFSDLSLIEAIEAVDETECNSFGVQDFCFYPMSDEKPHVSGDDVRKYYDYFEMWDKAAHFEQDIFPEPNRLWKINAFKCRTGLSYGNSHKLEPLSKVKLFPYLFIARHYPFRSPERTKKRIIEERRNRLSEGMIQTNTSQRYHELSKRKDFFFDELKQGGELYGLERRLFKWSEFRKPSLREALVSKQ